MSYGSTNFLSSKLSAFLQIVICSNFLWPLYYCGINCNVFSFVYNFIHMVLSFLCVILAKGLLIFIFSKNYFLILLIVCIFFCCTFHFICSDFYFLPSANFRFSFLCFFFLFIWGIVLCILFEIFLFLT